MPRNISTAKRRFRPIKIDMVAREHEQGQPRRYRIRRCNGNKSAWLLTALRDDGTEIDSYGSCTTSLSLDSLLARAGHLTPMPGDIVELVP